MGTQAQPPACPRLHNRRLSAYAALSDEQTLFSQRKIGVQNFAMAGIISWTLVRLPVFSFAHGLEVSWEAYVILSVTVHSGPRPHSCRGYRRHPSKHSWALIITDDGRAACFRTEQQLQHSRCN